MTSLLVNNLQKFQVQKGLILHKTIRLMEFSTEGENIGSLLSDRKDSFNGFAFLHDFAITPNWAIFLQNAISFNPLPFLLGQKGAAQCLASKSDGLIPKLKQLLGSMKK